MKMQLTEQGKNLLLLALAAKEQIKFKSIVLGNGANVGLEAQGLSNPLLTVALTGFSADNTFATLTGIFSNSEVTASFRATEMGVFVEDPNNAEADMLYAYGYADASEADFINRGGSDQILETKLDVLIYVGNAENVQAELSSSTIYVSKEDFGAHVNDKTNPHSVTAKQIGLDKVQNCSTNDQTPTYEAATLAELKSGEKLSVAFGKLAAAVKKLIDHLSDKNNPHGLTAELLSAAKKEHTHSAADINSGTLGIARGGTGAATAEKARENLGAAAASHKHAASEINSGTLGIARGGTGAATAEKARANLGAAAVSHGHAASEITAGTFSTTDIKAATGTDYATYRLRNAAILLSTPTSMDNGAIAFVCI